MIIKPERIGNHRKRFWKENERNDCNKPQPWASIRHLLMMFSKSYDTSTPLLMSAIENYIFSGVPLRATLNEPPDRWVNVIEGLNSSRYTSFILIRATQKVDFSPWSKSLVTRPTRDTNDGFLHENVWNIVNH